MENIIKEILNKVKQNKKYSSIADEIIKNEIANYLKKNPNIKAINKQIIKDIRKNLHKSYASFQTKKKNKINDYLEELKKDKNDGKITKNLLSITLSTKERLDDYENIYKQIFKITGKPNTILDLGCGFNPFSYPLMNLDKLTYYCYEINKKDIDYLNEYFKIMEQNGLNGTAAILDLKDLRQIFKMPSSDIVFLWKVIDILDKENHKLSEELIKQLIKKTRFIVASFATKTLTRKQMNYPNRKWFELMLSRNNLEFSLIKTDNELFYVITKHN